MRTAGFLVFLVPVLLRPGTAQTYFDVPSAYPTIQAALNAATPGGIVRIAAGTYTGSGNTDLDPLGKAITIRGAGSATTIVDCQGSLATPRRGFVLTSGGTSLVIEHLTVANGYAARGGAMDIVNARPTVRDCVFQSCQATGNGGAVWLDGVAPARFTNCTFQQCQADQGGALFVFSVFPVTVTGCTFTNNAAVSYGGAVRLDAMQLTIDDCTFTGNACLLGGAVGASYTSTLTVQGSTFSGNTAQASGGAILVDTSSVAMIRNSSLTNNTAGPWPGDGNGGAIRGEWSLVTILDCVLTDNRGHGSGGAVLLANQAGCRMERCQLSRNVANDYGGALFGSSDITVLDCAFDGNASLLQSGAAIAFHGNGTFDLRGGHCSNNVGPGALAVDGPSGSVTNVTFDNNQTPIGNGAWGAAARIGGLASAVDFVGCRFRGNQADGAGAMQVYGLAATLFDDCEISGNTARNGDAGALAVNSSATATLRRCRIVDNMTVGWIAAARIESATARFEGCLLAGNGAAGEGVVWSGGTGALVEFDSCTIAGNASNAHALLVDGGTMTLENTIVWGNFRWSYRVVNGGSLTATHCDIEGGVPGVGNLNLDPQFVDLFGGDYHLTAMSPARDAGNGALLPATLTTDLDNNPRVWGTAVDLGADEFAPLWPGTADPLRLETLVNGAAGALTVKSAAAGDRVEVRVTSGPSLYGAIGAAIANLVPVGTPIVPTPWLPGFQVDLATSIVLAGGFAPPPFGWEYLSPVALHRTYTVPPGLAGLRLRVQAVALGSQTLSGFIGCSEAQEIVF